MPMTSMFSLSAKTSETVTSFSKRSTAHLTCKRNEQRGDTKAQITDLVSSGRSTVELDFRDVALLLAERQLVDLGVDDGTDDRGVLVELVDLGGTSSLALWGTETGNVVGESLALLVEALVEAALERVRQVLSPHGGEGAEAAGGLDVSNNTDDDDRGSLDNGHGLDDLLLVGLGASSVKLTDDVRHSSLEGEETRQVYRLALHDTVSLCRQRFATKEVEVKVRQPREGYPHVRDVSSLRQLSRNSSFPHHPFNSRDMLKHTSTYQLVLGEGLELALAALGALAGLEAKIAVARDAELAVGPGG